MSRTINFSEMDFDAVIFDFDGTLADSMWMWNEIDRVYLERFGISLCADEVDKLQKGIEGMSFTETAEYFKKKFSLPDSIDKIKSDWTDMSLEKYKHEVELKPYVREFLELLKKKGKKLGIATSNGRDMIRACMESLKITEYFDKVAISCEVERGKPYPDIYEYVAKGLGVSPERCLAFEDIPAGITAAKSAGMTVFAVEDDFSLEMKKEKEELADFYIKDYGELLEKSRE